jgi:hypothetical protein
MLPAAFIAERKARNMPLRMQLKSLPDPPRRDGIPARGGEPFTGLAAEQSGDPP